MERCCCPLKVCFPCCTLLTGISEMSYELKKQIKCKQMGQIKNNRFSNKISTLSNGEETTQTLRLEDFIRETVV
jgi:hypothetical protein